MQAFGAFSRRTTEPTISVDIVHFHSQRKTAQMVQLVTHAPGLPNSVPLCFIRFLCQSRGQRFLAHKAISAGRVQRFFLKGPEFSLTGSNPGIFEGIEPLSRNLNSHGINSRFPGEKILMDWCSGVHPFSPCSKSPGLSGLPGRTQTLETTTNSRECSVLAEMLHFRTLRPPNISASTRRLMSLHCFLRIPCPFSKVFYAHMLARGALAGGVEPNVSDLIFAWNIHRTAQNGHEGTSELRGSLLANLSSE